MKFQLLKAFSIGIAATTACTLLSMFPVGTSAADNMTADEITKEMSIGWNIGNSLDANGVSPSHEQSWGNPTITKELIDTVKSKGFNTIRIPTTWYTEVITSKDENGNPVYTIKEEWLTRVKEVVDYCYDNDMYVILNLHHEEWINRSDFPTAYEEMSVRLKQMWTQIATYFKDYDQHLIFEGMNEPRQTGVSWEWQGTPECFEVVNKLDNDFIETVRSIDSPYRDTRLLMVPAYAASGYASAYSYLEVPENDDYVAVSLHAYTPYNFAMGNGDHTVFSSNYQADLDTLFSDIQYYWTDRDIPAVLGEFSASNFDNTDARCDWANYYVSWAKKLGIPCVLWDNNAYTNSDGSEAHGYLNRSTLQWYEKSEPVVDVMMNVIQNDSIVWGSEKHLPKWVHSDIEGGNIIFEDTAGLQLIASDGNGGNCTPGKPVDSTQHLSADKEIAVRYDGNVAPVLALTNDAWGNWTEISAYAIDEEKGIAYYSYDAIAKAWGGDLSTAAHLFARATSDLKVYKIAAIPAATLDTPLPPEILLGDVNEDSKPYTLTDLVVLQKYLLGQQTISEAAFLNADISNDGKVNGKDLTLFRQTILEY